ncbi:hypothetical protein COTS27_01462 [Spirochaetota bacterium]|nr:hypothetical protein COTS27_01462 [Spirochaetota bacterium]
MKSFLTQLSCSLQYYSYKVLFVLVVLVIFALFIISGCNAYSPQQTTSILTYPTPRITNLSIEQLSDQTRIQGEVAITLNPSINNDLREYWLLLASNVNSDFSNIDVTELNEITSLDAVRTGSRAPVYIPYLFNILQDVNNNFSGLTVANYEFNLPITNSQNDYFYHLSVRAWGSNDSYAVAYQNNGWIVSDATAPMLFYVGYQTNCTFPVTTLAGTSVGYSHRPSAPDAAGGSACSDIIGSDPDIIFYTVDYTPPNGTPTNQLKIDVASTAQPNVGILPPSITNIGTIVDISNATEESYITRDQHGIGFLATPGRIFLVRHRTGAYFSKIRINTISTVAPYELSITILYAGVNGAGFSSF